MPSSQAPHTNNKLIVHICVILSQILIWYSGSGILRSILALITSWDAFVALGVRERDVSSYFRRLVDLIDDITDEVFDVRQLRSDCGSLKLSSSVYTLAHPTSVKRKTSLQNEPQLSNFRSSSEHNPSLAPSIPHIFLRISERVYQQRRPI